MIKKYNQENNDSDESIEGSGLKPKRRERKLATNYYKGFRNSVKYTSYWLSCIDKLLKFEDSDLFEINNSKVGYYAKSLWNKKDEAKKGLAKSLTK